MKRTINNEVRCQIVSFMLVWRTLVDVSMNYFMLASFFLFLEASAIIEKVRVISDSKRSIILFSENHDAYLYNDRRQLSDFIQTLVERDKRNMKPLDILIEQPLSNLGHRTKVTSSLIDEAAHYPLQNIHIKDIEIRNAAILASMILSRNENSHMMGQPPFDSISIVDIINEFNHYFHLIEPYQAFLRKHIGNSQLKRSLDLIFEEQQYFVNLIHHLCIQPSESILTTIKRFNVAQNIATAHGTTETYDYDRVRRILLGRIVDFSSALFDLYILYSILTLPDTHDIALIAGAAHIESLNYMLTDWERSKYRLKRLEANTVTNVYETSSAILGLSGSQVARALL